MSIFKLILLLSFSTQCHTATVNMSVQLEQNVTLPCFLNSSSEMAWMKVTLGWKQTAGLTRSAWRSLGSESRIWGCITALLVSVQRQCALGLLSDSHLQTLNSGARQRVWAAGRSWSVLVSYVGFAVFSACVCSVTGKVLPRSLASAA
ncbi:uncharacterized protein LOC131525454 isoform X2 [Onychostoma macrolepis]|uniref:uncharacterized protein LOC131525454 isoform X2 n=1 Tax=Onychostoma macrolepis TaxID=369639 RepID=UPI00272BBC35|nr:uncharacterized protein LOC131525454 isoform X2 [Onychostoma macrolepis]